MIMHNYSLTGWRIYHIPGFLKEMQKDGYKKISKLERDNNIEIMIIKENVYVRPNFKY